MLKLVRIVMDRATLIRKRVMGTSLGCYSQVLEDLLGPGSP
jgi:hypothetical protein